MSYIDPYPKFFPEIKKCLKRFLSSRYSRYLSHALYVFFARSAQNERIQG